MSIISELFYACRCDNCGELSEDGEGHPFFGDEDTAKDNAINYNEWKEIHGKDICNLCYAINDDDTITINKKRFKAVDDKGEGQTKTE